MNRIHRNYRFIVGFNCMLIALGVAGVIQPTTSALLHNASTLGISLDSMTDLLDKEKECKSRKHKQQVGIIRKTGGLHKP